MLDSTLIKFGLITSLAGIYILLTFTEIQAEKKYINEITEKQIDKRIKIFGYVDNVKYTDKTSIIKVRDLTGRMNIISFKKISPKKGSLLQIEGKVAKYNNELEILANNIILY